MSVESEILRIQHNIANTYAAVSEKGGEVPLQPTSANLAAAVASIPQTLSPPDNNPIGTVISYMGLTAPKDYLVCDGAEYNIADYPVLAAHFSAQFGTANHFGGDGETTFAVPDMRNLFLRGFHGEAEEQLSGEVGERQEATEHYNIRTDRDSYMLVYRHDGFPLNADSASSSSVDRYGLTAGDLNPDCMAVYTSRPVNMAVLYCIKATESYPAEDVYSTEETRIGTWIDGKPLYRKSFEGVYASSASDHKAVAAISNLEKAVNIFGVTKVGGHQRMIQTSDGGREYTWVDENNILCIQAPSNAFFNMPFWLSLEYAKTTDSPTTVSASSLNLESAPLAIKMPESSAQAIASTAADMT